MLRSNPRIIAILALSAGMLFPAADVASAQATAKKPTYEQAWAICKADLQAALPGDTTQSAARYTRGAGCMKRFGYRLKKSSMQ